MCFVQLHCHVDAATPRLTWPTSRELYNEVPSEPASPQGWAPPVSYRTQELRSQGATRSGNANFAVLAQGRLGMDYDLTKSHSGPEAFFWEVKIHGNLETLSQ